MPIEALPLSTAKRICSAQVIFDPCSVVKELLDNSLDARATSASVEISSNTLDVIQIRDNGHGIPHEDRTLVCVRHCTSKLRDISELHIVGGTWLGFRGQALSSLVEISGGLSITTRVEGEIATEKLEIGKDGDITRFDPYYSRKKSPKLNKKQSRNSLTSSGHHRVHHRPLPPSTRTQANLVEVRSCMSSTHEEAITNIRPGQT